MSEWQPIETAPLGLEVLLLVPRRRLAPRVVSAHNLTGRQWWATNIGPVTKATHWMHLPEPPK